MKSKVHTRGPAEAAMNITPLIDVVFLLIIFFMLVSNIISEETVEMMVPDLDEPVVYELEGNTITVSVPLAEEWDQRDRQEAPLNIPGQAGVIRLGALKDFADVRDLEGLTQQLEIAKQERPGLEVVLRADAAVYYQDVQLVYQAIAAAGIETINMVALLED